MFVLILGLVAAMATAGQIILDYNGSTGIAYNSTYSNPYGMNGGWFMGQAYSNFDLATCSGSIKVNLRWESAYAGEQRPKFVVVHERSEAIWIGEFGSASNGLGSPELNGVSAGSQRRIVELTQLPNSEEWGGSYTLSPFCTSTAMSLTFPSYALVRYKVLETLPVSIELNGSGVVNDPTGARNSNLKMLATIIGKRLTGTLSCDKTEETGTDGYYCANYTWSISGTVFSMFELATDDLAGEAKAVSQATRESRKCKWIWSQDGSRETVSVSAKLYFDGELIGDVAGEVRVFVGAPTVTDDGSTLWPGGPGWTLQPAPPNGPTYLFACSGNIADASTVHAYRRKNKVYVAPDPNGIDLSQIAGQGSWQYVQLVTPKKYLNGSLDPPESRPEGLDQSFPYSPAAGGGIHSALFSQKSMFDSPAIDIGAGGTSFALKHDFKVFLMYKPAGDGDWVTVGFQTWSMDAAGTFPEFSAPPPAPISKSNFDQTYRQHPKWSVKYQMQL